VWHLLEVTGIYAADTDTMSGILDAHATDTMNQIPMAMIPIHPCS
jgi:hypothetical protein